VACSPLRLLTCALQGYAQEAVNLFRVKNTESFIYALQCAAFACGSATCLMVPEPTLSQVIDCWHSDNYPVQ
jgi:hypothetical protein